MRSLHAESRFDLDMDENREKWLTRRVGFVQGQLIRAGHELGFEDEMPSEAREVVRDALAEFERRWPLP